ncbi:hypothetical protein CPT_Muenster_250 [Klebsiella phage Muenster]|nr:hypothetical protein CPT_Muenster_250 [Klebsiella phage Muenster]
MRDVLNEVKYISTWINNIYLINKNKSSIEINYKGITSNEY